jgi:NAD(P)-dependent dehydrogenase (short-subunit alcohol dehydrogenase family)
MAIRRHEMTQSGTLRIFKDAVAIVTGGASGLGRVLGEGLARRGAYVVLADLQKDLAEEVADGIRSRGGKADAFLLDVKDFGAVESLVNETAKAHGRLDYIFNNAGIAVGGEARYYKMDDWYHIYDVNLRGVTHGVQAAYQVMLRQGFGHIVNTASMAGLLPTPFTVSYGTTKHAVVGLSTSLRIEAAEAGIRVSALCPGYIRTAILEGGGKYGRIVQEASPETQKKLADMTRPMDLSLFADKVLPCVARNDAIIVVPWGYRIVWWLQRLSPAIGLFIARKMFERVRKEMGPPPALE